MQFGAFVGRSSLDFIKIPYLSGIAIYMAVL